MNWIFQLEEAWKVAPDFWWEISTWDGNGGGWTPEMGYRPDLVDKSKACQYFKDGQTYTPERFLGWIQFGLWLLRPRVVREFRGSTVPLEPWRPFFEKLLLAVDRVHRNGVLEPFWRHGRLVPNRADRHPCQEAIPEKYRDVDRWFLLDTDLDPPRPWTLTTNLPVFSMALVLVQPGSRRWLVYAHSPLEDRRQVRITLPGFGPVTMDVPRVGTFHIVDEKTRQVRLVELRRATQVGLYPRECARPRLNPGVANQQGRMDVSVLHKRDERRNGLGNGDVRKRGSCRTGRSC